MTRKNILPLQKEIVYGPVLSRRLGRSLGINILSPWCKICSFDCVYCHYGRTATLTACPEKSSIYSTGEILRAVERALLLTRHLNVITFSGNGEPTLHPDFDVIVKGVRDLRDRLQPDVKLAIFSNATMLENEKVRRGLDGIDIPILKLDAGEVDLFWHINHPAPGITLEKVVSSLQNIGRIILQTVLIDGDHSNVTDRALALWEELLVVIKPERAQIYSTDRPVPEDGVVCITPMRLKQIAEDTQRHTGILVDAYWAG